MLSPHDEPALAPAGSHDSHAARQRSARNDPSMRDGDSGRGNPYEDAPEEFRTDDDVGDVIAQIEDPADAVPLDDEAPKPRAGASSTVNSQTMNGYSDDEAPKPRAGASAQIPNAESAVVPTADHTATGADRGGADDSTFEADDEVLAAAEEATGTRHNAAAAAADHEDRSDENNRAVRGEAPLRRQTAATQVTAPPRRSAAGKTRPADPALPIEGYRGLTVPEILDRVFAMPIDDARAVQAYERAHLRRKTLLVKLERYLRGK